MGRGRYERGREVRGEDARRENTEETAERRGWDTGGTEGGVWWRLLVSVVVVLILFSLAQRQTGIGERV